MKSDLRGLDPFSLEPKLRGFEITTVADEHVKQSYAIILARDTIRNAGEALAATFANIAEMIVAIHGEAGTARNMPRMPARKIVHRTLVSG
jgi:hypothetical protein